MGSRAEFWGCTNEKFANFFCASQPIFPLQLIVGFFFASGISRFWYLWAWALAQWSVSAPRIGLSPSTDLYRAHVIGQLQAGVPQNQIATLFGVRDIIDRPRSRRSKKTMPQQDGFRNLSALRYCRQSSPDLQSGFAGWYHWLLSAQIIHNRQLANLRSHWATRRPAMAALHHQTHLDWRKGTWTCGKMLCSLMSPQQLDRRVQEWRRCREPYADFCNDTNIFWWKQCDGVWQHLSHLKNKTCQHWRRSQCRETEMIFCNQWWSPYLHLSETTSRVWECRGWNALPAVLTSTPFNTCWISSPLNTKHVNGRKDLTNFHVWVISGSSIKPMTQNLLPNKVKSF